VLLVLKDQGEPVVQLGLLANLAELVRLARWDLRVAEDLLVFAANKGNAVTQERQANMAVTAKLANEVHVATLVFQELVVNEATRVPQAWVCLDLLVVLEDVVSLACRDLLAPEDELVTMGRQVLRVRRAKMAKTAKTVKMAKLVRRVQQASLARKDPRVTAVNPSCKCI